MTETGTNRWAAALNHLCSDDRKALEFDGKDKLNILKDLQSMTEDAKEESIRKRWRFRRPGRAGETIILRDLLSKIIAWINRFKEIGDIVVQYDPTHAALPWAGVRFLLQIAVGDINKFDFVVEGAEMIAHCISRFAILEKIYLQNATSLMDSAKALEETVIRLYASIFVYLARAKKYFDQKTASRTLSVLVNPQEDYESLMRDIDKEQANADHCARLVDAENSNHIGSHLSALSLDQQEKHAQLQKLFTSINGPICRMNSRLDSVEDKLDRGQRFKILRWLSSQPYPEHHQQIARQALEGSGKWLLHDPVYKRWRNSSVSSLLWLHGLQGSGKSTLVSIAINDVQKSFKAGQNPPPIYFYCSRSSAEPERSDPNAVTASIVRQLCCLQPDQQLPLPVVELYKDKGEGFSSKGPYLEESAKLVKELVNSYDVTTIFVDALDECDLDNRQFLLDTLEDILTESSALVKVFVSSRNDHDIVRTLREYPNLDISSDKNMEDIENFVRTHTQTLVQRGRLLCHSRAQEEMLGHVVDQVCAGADGMFRWASLQLDLLCTLKSDTDIRSRLRRIPPKLEDLYAEIYDGLTSGPGATDHVIIKNTLTWLLCAQRKMQSSEFLCAVAVKAEVAAEEVTRDMVLELCHNLIVYDNGLDTFRFAHLSVREFLETKPDYAKVSCHSLAAESCLLYLIGSVPYPATAPALTDRFIVELRERLRFSNTVFHAGMLNYSNLWWTYHCKVASQDTRLAHTSFMQVFHDFMWNGFIYREALHAWAEWFCRIVPESPFDTESQDPMINLQTLVRSHPNALSRVFFISIAYGFRDMIHVVLQKGHISKQEKTKALALAAVYDEGCSFDILIDTDLELEIPLSILRKIVQRISKDRLIILWERYPSTDLEHSLVIAGLASGDDGKITMLLERHPNFAITEETLIESFKLASPGVFALLLTRFAERAVYHHVLSKIIRGMRHTTWNELNQSIRSKLAILRLIVERAGPSCITPDSVISAVDQLLPTKVGEGILEILFEYGGASMITEEAMIEAARRESRGVLDTLLRHGGQVTQRVLDEAATYVKAEILEVLISWGCEINSSILKQAAQAPNLHLQVNAGLDVLLEFAGEEIVAQEALNLLRDVASSIDPSPDGLRLLLDRTGEVSVTEDILMVAAAKYGYDENKKLQLLLERARNSEISQDVIIQSFKSLGLDGALRLLERVGMVSIAKQCLVSAAENMRCGGELVRNLLKKTDLVDIPEQAVAKALTNGREGFYVLLALEEFFGPIEMTEERLLRALSLEISKFDFAYDASPISMLWVTPEVLTQRVLIAAMRQQCHKILPPILPQRFAEQSSHLAIGLEILEAAAENQDVIFFRFLWNRGRLATVPERLVKAAARNHDYGLQIIEFLFDEAEEVEISNQVYVTILEEAPKCESILNLLCEREYPPQVTQTILESATIAPNEAIKKLLELNPNLEITDELFRSRATHGEEEILHKVAKYCGLEKPPSRWIDISKLFGAAREGDHIALQELVDRKVEPNILDPWGLTPLCRAVLAPSISSVNILLSAGADPNLAGEHDSPLSRAARWEDIDMVKVLVEAGASINFKDEEGKTPEVIAKEDGDFRAFRYLERCRKMKEEAEQNT